MLDPGAGRPCILLFSGGLDSTTLLALASTNDWRVYALTLRYSQRHAFELAAAQRTAERWNVARHAEIQVDLRAFGGSALTADLPVPKRRNAQTIGSGIPQTYVPARNTIFLSLALAWAETLGAPDILIGVNALDYSGYPDCRPEFVRAFERLANLATKAGVEGSLTFRVHAPLIAMTKREIIQLGAQLGVDYGDTSSCYDPEADGTACGECDACVLRRKGFAEAGLTDPVRYATSAL